MNTNQYKISDAEKNQSSLMNATSIEKMNVNTGGLKVVFIGNSITLHAKLPRIGWYNEWGMAASAAEKDYVHLVIAAIEKKFNRKTDVRIRNLADFERNFQNYDFGKNQDLIDFKPDFLIVALGENVGALETEEEQIAYREAFKNLLAGFMDNSATPKAVVRGVFWPNEWKDKMMQDAAAEFNIPFVKGDFSTDESTKAIGLFEHAGVQAHPNDKGMKAIAECILAGLFVPDQDR